MAPILWLLQIWDLYAFKWIYDTGVRKYGTSTSTVNKKKRIIYTSSSPTGALHLRCHLLQGRLCLLSVDCYWTSDQRQPCQMITMLNEPKTILFDTICGKSMETYFKKIHLRISCINSIDANPIRHNLGRHSHLPGSGLSTWQWLERWWRSLDLQWIAFQDFQTKAFC